MARTGPANRGMSDRRSPTNRSKERPAARDPFDWLRHFGVLDGPTATIALADVERSRDPGFRA